MNHYTDIQLMQISYEQLQERAQGRFVLHLLLKDKVAVKHLATIDLHQLKPHLHTRTHRISGRATIIGKDGSGNRMIIIERRIARDAWSRMLND
ncbi:MAG: hypothetical protein EZS28_000745 [Streblomastix strix]|uniref:Uncharacterized protein n=1 Tax=Streblomastix strix TaxID=222440 RepID=A0A5J4XAA1_9EUKA|nr:MAG: hypothetical protein EZS28_000745 [Streblomastix strix]